MEISRNEKFALYVLCCIFLWLCQAHPGLPVGFLLLPIQFYLLLSPYLCFISFLYLDLYVLGDDALIS